VHSLIAIISSKVQDIGVSSSQA